MFGTPRPKGHAEIVEALEELELDPSSVEIEITHQEAESTSIDFDGFSAEVRGFVDDESAEFTTMGYSVNADLVADLKAAGILAADKL